LGRAASALVVAAALGAGALLGAGAPPGAAEREGRPAAAARDPRIRELERLRDEIARLQVRLGRVQQQEQSVGNELEQTSLQLELQEQRLLEAKTARSVAADRTALVEKEVGGLESRLATVRAALRGHLSALYRLGRAGYLRLLLALAPGEEVLPAMRQLRYLARRDGELLQQFHDTRARLAAEQGTLLQERARLQGWVQQEEQRTTRLAVLRQQQATLLARVEEERKSLESKSGALAEQAEKLSNLVAFLYGRATPSEGKPIQGFRGVLDWPVEGKVTAPFGPKLDPRYGTRVPHHGIDIATHPEDEVHAIFPGTVVFAAPFAGYGQTVIVNHPGRVFTLYAGLQQVRTSENAVLTLGQVLGTAGDSLYFEIRLENRPEDPLPWFREHR
jgi:septal ring factor EnvC (AmiA/AmiB activator)